MINESKSIDLFDCLTEKEKARGKRKGVRMAKRANRIDKILNWFDKHFKRNGG